jgi:hypothetical protein
VWPIEEGRDSAQVREADRADRARVTILSTTYFSAA